MFDPPTTYRLLANGLTNTSSSYNDIDFSAFDASYEEGRMVRREVVTHYDNITNGLHALLVDLPSLEDSDVRQLEQSRSKLLNDITTYGQDFVATRHPW